MLLLSIILLLSFTVSSFAASQGVNLRGRTIKIGWFGPTSGILQKIGQGMVDGMKAYIDRENSRGGVGGFKVKLVVYDNNNDPITTKQVVKKLVKRDRIFALVGALGSKGVNAVIAELKSYGIPCVYFGGGEYSWAVPPKEIFSQYNLTILLKVS